MIKRGRQAGLEIFDIAKRVTAVYADPAASAAEGEAGAAGAGPTVGDDAGAGDLAGLSDADIEVCGMGSLALDWWQSGRSGQC